MPSKLNFANNEVVISGMAGYFPNANNTDELRDNLFKKEFVMQEYTDRIWRSVTRDGLSVCMGMMPKKNCFDSRFFGLPKKIADPLDPMVRIIMERSMEAMVDAGVNPFTLRGKNIGVVIGSNISESESSWLFFDREGGSGILGHNRAMLANRISYFFNFHGPSFATLNGDIAGAHALEIGMRMVRDGECEAALVGCTNMIIHPNINKNMNQLNLLSPDGHTRCFDAEANGFGRSEACPIFFVQRKQDAKRIYASVIDSGHIYVGNRQDDYLSTKPEYQISFLKDFYERSGVDPKQIDFIEAEGRAIKENDSDELNSMEEFFFKIKGRTHPIYIGAVNSNIGHSGPSSNFCSLVKVLIAMQEGTIPPNLDYNQPSPFINGLHNGNFKVVNEPVEWKGGIVAINGMGLGSEYSHILLKSHGLGGKKNISTPADGLPRLVLISGRTEDGLKTLIERLNKMPIDPESIRLLHDVYYTKIPNHLYRSYTILGEDSNDTREIMRFDGDTRPVWFIFSGMGSQWPKMACHLMKLPIFAETIEICHQILLPKGLDLKHIITTDDDTIFDNILHSFVGIAAVQMALVDVMRSLGIVPDGIIGHSVGELGCAYADGCFTREQMILSAYSRGKASLEAKLIQGMMAAIGLSYEQILPMLPEDLEVACHNSKNSCTISGPTKSVENFVEELKAKEIFARTVNVSNIAYHSRYIKPAAPALLNYLKEVIPNPIKRSSKWISTSVPENKWNSELAQYSSPEYHTNNLLSSVLFEEGSVHIPSNAICIEIAPHGLLQAILRRSLGSGVTNIPLTQRGHKDGLIFLLNNIAKMYLYGLSPKIENIYPMVTYPVSKGTPSISSYVDWDHTEEWVEISSSFKVTITTPCEKTINISLNNLEDRMYKGYLHQGTNIYPLSGFLYGIWDLICGANDFSMQEVPIIFENIKMHEILYIPPKGTISIQFFYQRGTGLFEINSATDEKLYVTGHARIADFEAPTDQWMSPEFRENMINDLNTSMESTTEAFHLDVQDIYSQFERHGHTFSGPFRSLDNLTISKRGAVGSIAWTDEWIQFLDGLMQVPLFKIEEGSHNCRLTTSIERLIIDPRMLPKGNNNLNLLYLQPLNLVLASGIEMRGVESVPLFIDTHYLPQFHIDKDVYLSSKEPNIQDYDSMLSMFLNIVLINCSKSKLKVDSLLHGKNSQLIDDINKILPTLDFSSNIEYEFREFSSNSSSVSNLVNLESNHLIISDKCKEAYELLAAYPQDTCLLIHMAPGQPEPPNQFKILCRKSFRNECFLLIKQLIKVNENSRVLYLKENSKEWNKQISTLRARSNDERIYVVFKMMPSHGIIEFIKLFMSENLSENIRLVLLLDSNSPEFSLNDKFYKEQLSLDYFVNILYNNEWGYFLRLPIDKVTPIQGNDLNLCLLSTSQYRNIEFKYIGLNPNDITHTELEEKEKQQIYARDLETNHLEWSGLINGRHRSMGIANLIYSKIDLNKYYTWTIPENWSYEDAATVPLVYTFAYHCLYNQADISQNNLKVLIHCGSNYFSQAAINIVLSTDNTLFVTVSNENEKKQLLHQYPKLASEQILLLSSFENEILKRTDGKGLEVIFSAVPDQELRATFRCLGYMGKFIHVGTKDIHRNTQIGTIKFLECCSFYITNLETLFSINKANQENIHKLMENGLQSGVVKPLKRTQYPFENLDLAIKSIRDSLPLVKTIVEMPSKPLLGPISKKQKHLLRKYFYGDVSNLIISSRMDYALDLAEWLNERGVRYLFIAAYDNNNSSSITSNIQFRLDALIRKYNSQIVLIPSKPAIGWTSAQELVNQCQTTAPFANVFLINLDGSSELVRSLDSITRQKNRVDIFAALHCWNIQDLILNRQHLNHSAVSINIKDGSKSEFWQYLGCLDRVFSFDTNAILSIVRLKPQVSSKGNFLSSNMEHNLQLFLPNIQQLESLGKEVSSVLKSRGDNASCSDLIEVVTRSVGIGYARDVPAIFMIPGLNGSSADTVRPIAKMLLYPVLVLQMPIHPGTLEEVADNFVQQILNVQDIGPFNLCGVSWGGPLAIESARRLEKLGHTVKVFLYEGAPDTIQAKIKLLNEAAIKEVNLICHCLEIKSLRIRDELLTLPNWSSRVNRALDEISVPKMKRNWLNYGLETLRCRLELISQFPYEYDPLISCDVHLTHSSEDDDICGLDRYTKTNVDFQPESIENTFSEIINMGAAVVLGRRKYKIPLQKRYLKV